MNTPPSPFKKLPTRPLRRWKACCGRSASLALGVILAALPAMVPGAAVVGDAPALADLCIEELMQISIPTVYGASKHDQKTTDAPSSVTIVTREEIQVFGHRTLGDVLRSVRDFYVTNDRNYGYIGVRGVNRPGDFGGRILLLVDGLRLNDPIFDGAAALNDFPVDVDLIERVEIIRGPGSALYGNNAFFAVINVITRTGGEVSGVEASGEIGSLDTYKGRLTYGKVFQNGLSLLLTGTLFDSAGNDRLYFKEFDQPINNRGLAEGRDADFSESVGLTLGYKDFTLQAGYVSRRKDVPTASYGTVFNDPTFYTLDQRSFTRLTYAHDFEDELRVRADLHWNSYYYKGDYPFPGDEVDPHVISLYRDMAHAQWWGAELQVSKQLFKTHHVTLGGEFRDNQEMKMLAYYVSPYAADLNSQTSASTLGVYVQDEWAISKKLTLHVGLRYDWIETFGSTVNPRGALLWHPFDRTTFKLLYGQAYRAPNAFESFYVTSSSRSSREVEPEQVKSYELVLEQAMTTWLRLSASAFYNRIDGLISQQEGPGPGFHFENEGLAETKGGSVELEAKLPKGIKARASYTLQRTADVVTGERFSNSPEQLAKLNLIVPLYRDKVLSGLELQYFSETENAKHQATSGYVLANWTLFSRELVKNLEASAGIYNLFDKKYAFPGGPEHLPERIQQDGRTFRLKFTFRF